MNLEDLIDLINSVASNPDLNFKDKGEEIEAKITSLSRSQIIELLDTSGVIPERFSHDSTEEKLFAKYCDALFSCSLRQLGFNSETLDSRGDSADIYADNKEYDLVGDAKAFRLSRTAKNQKDFKVTALNEWKKDADYACLLSPIYQYPNTYSQIYKQAIKHNVTLFSYAHLSYVLSDDSFNPKNFEQILNSGKDLELAKDAQAYWDEINSILSAISGKSIQEIDTELSKRNERIKEQAQIEIRYWKERIDDVKNMDKKRLVQEVIQAKKIDKKIKQIEKTIDF